MCGLARKALGLADLFLGKDGIPDPVEHRVYEVVQLPGDNRLLLQRFLHVAYTPVTALRSNPIVARLYHVPPGQKTHSKEQGLAHQTKPPDALETQFDKQDRAGVAPPWIRGQSRNDVSPASANGTQRLAAQRGGCQGGRTCPEKLLPDRQG